MTSTQQLIFIVIGIVIGAVGLSLFLTPGAETEAWSNWQAWINTK